jgi:phage tail protein X
MEAITSPQQITHRPVRHVPLKDFLEAAEGLAKVQQLFPLGRHVAGIAIQATPSATEGLQQ